MLNLLSPAILTPALAFGAIASSYLWLKTIHEPNIRAAYAAEIQVITEREKARLQETSIAILEAQHEAQKAREASIQVIYRTVANAPQATSCASSPAMRAALDGLRASSGGAGAPANPAKPTSLPAGANAP